MCAYDCAPIGDGWSARDVGNRVVLIQRINGRVVEEVSIPMVQAHAIAVSMLAQHKARSRSLAHEAVAAMEAG